MISHTFDVSTLSPAALYLSITNVHGDFYSESSDLVKVFVNGNLVDSCYPGDECTAAGSSKGAPCVDNLNVTALRHFQQGGAGREDLMQVNLTYVSPHLNYFCDVFLATATLAVSTRLASCPPTSTP